MIDAYRLIAEGAAIIVLTGAGVLLLGWRRGSARPGIVRRGVWWIRDQRNVMLCMMGMSLAIAAIAVYVAVEKAKDARAAQRRAEIAERNQKAAEFARDAAFQEWHAAAREWDAAARGDQVMPFHTLDDEWHAAARERDATVQRADKAIRVMPDPLDEILAMEDELPSRPPKDPLDETGGMKGTRQATIRNDKDYQLTIIDIWRKLKRKMSRDQVKAILGEPTTFEEGEVLQFWYYRYPGANDYYHQGTCTFSADGLWKFECPDWPQ